MLEANRIALLNTLSETIDRLIAARDDLRDSGSVEIIVDDGHRARLAYEKMAEAPAPPIVDVDRVPRVGPPKCAVKRTSGGPGAKPLSGLHLQLLVGEQQHADHCTDDAADGGEPEQPELSRCAVTVEERNAGRARRVHRGVADRDRDEVDQRERQADRDTGEAGGARLSVEPRMTIRKNAVSRISAISTATRPYPSGECAPNPLAAMLPVA